MIGADELLLLGVVVLYTLHRATRWMYRRGWIHWKTRGTSSSLGNAVLAVQTIFQPQYREVLESRLEEPDERETSGEPPQTGT